MDRIPFVGREQELAALHRCLDAAQGGQGQLVLVGGEPGVGKTRLLAELSEGAKAEGWQVLAGRAYDSEGMPPYLPFSEALRDYTRAVPLEDLRAQIDEAGPDAALLAPDIHRRLPDLPTSPPASPEEQRYRLFESVCDFLLGIPGHSESRGLILILDDLHWADPSSLLLFQHLARRLTRTPLLLAGAYRSEEVSQSHPLAAVLADLRRESIGERLALAPLPTAAIEALVRELAGVAPAAAVLQAVEQQTDGNPFFVGEVVRDLLANRRDLAAPATALAAAGVPEGVREVIERRLGRLGRSTNRMLQTAAVLGDGFTLQVLRASLESPPLAEGEAVPPPPLPKGEGRGEGAGLSDALDEATGAGMLRESGDGYQFGHALIRQTLYDGLGLARRQELHLRVAQALEAVHAGNLVPHAAALAMHYRLADGQGRKALAYAERVAERALASYAYAEAARHLEQALELQEVLDPDDRAKRCDLLLALGEALLPAGEPLRVAEAIMPEALALAESVEDERRATRACLLALEGLDRYGRSAMWGTPAWREWAERADRYAAPRTADRAQADMFLAVLRLHEGRIGDGRALLRSALDLALEHDDPATLLAVAPPFLNWGRPEDAEEQRRLAEEALAWPRGRLSVGPLGNLLWNCSFTLLNGGERAQAEALWSEVAELATRTRDPSPYSWIREVWGATLDGDLEGAVALGPRLLAQAEEAGAPVGGLHFVRQSTCRPLLYLGRGEEFLAARRPTGRMAGGESLARSLLLPLCLAHLGRRAEAQEALDRFLGAIRAGPAAADAITFALTTWLETAVLLEDRQATSFLAERLAPVAALATSTAPVVPTCIARHLGAASALLGDRRKARAYYELALDVAGRMRHRPEIALTHLGLAELLLDEGETNRADRAEAGARAGLKPAPTVDAGSVGARHASPSGSDAQRDEALQHLQVAITELRDMHMQPALERALQLEQRAAAATPRRRATARIYPGGLSEREVEVLRLVAAGKSNQAIADTLVISLNTVLHHMGHIFTKTNASNRAEAATYAHRHGLIEG